MEQLGFFGIVFGLLAAFWPVWVALALVLFVSFKFRPQLGLYGQLFETGIGIAGVMIVLF